MILEARIERETHNARRVGGWVGGYGISLSLFPTSLSFYLWWEANSLYNMAVPFETYFQSGCFFCFATYGLPQRIQFQSPRRRGSYRVVQNGGHDSETNRLSRCDMGNVCWNISAAQAAWCGEFKCGDEVKYAQIYSSLQRNTYITMSKMFVKWC